MACMPTASACRDEIEALHEFFVRWYTETISEDAIDRLETSLAPGFEMVSPDGSRLDRGAVLEWIGDSYGRDDPGAFEIEIRSVELIADLDDHATVRYEEWQETPAETTGRISTALFCENEAAPGGVVWVDLHETWLDTESDGGT